jgi:hypothetical protein
VGGVRHPDEELRRGKVGCINRRVRVAADDFVRDHIAGNVPVIISDAMDAWCAQNKWTPAFFGDNFGDLNTQIYDSLFTLQDMLPLRDYIEQAFNRSDLRFAETYARWFAKTKDLDFDWSDAVFHAIADDWSHPYFLPTSSYVMPFCRKPYQVSATRDSFPYRGLLISPRGARTRLHRDPYGTDTMLCQIWGSKRISFYHPCDRQKLMRGKNFVDLRQPDREVFPDFDLASPIYVDDLGPGEVLFVPAGWFHEVISITDSISVTWSFVHAANRDLFLEDLFNPAFDFDRDTLQFFFAGEGVRELSNIEIEQMAKSVEL